MPADGRAGQRMRLLPHPDQGAGAVTRFEVQATRAADGGVRLAWHLEVPAGEIRWAQGLRPGRVDGLWRHGCFEAFIARAGATGYGEFNFAPPGAWAAYGFTGYRAGMAELALPAAPDARWQFTPAGVALEVALPPQVAGGALRIGMAAVIESASGTIAWWALRHAPGAPDFHRPECFALELPSAERT